MWLLVCFIVFLFIFFLINLLPKPSSDTSAVEDHNKDPDKEIKVIPKKSPSDYTKQDVIDEFCNIYFDGIEFLDSGNIYDAIDKFEDVILFLGQMDIKYWDMLAEEPVKELISLYTKTRDYEKAIAIGHEYESMIETYNEEKLEEYLNKYPSHREMLIKASETFRSIKIEDETILFKNPYKFDKKIERAAIKLEEDFYI